MADEPEQVEVEENTEADADRQLSQMKQEIGRFVRCGRPSSRALRRRPCAATGDGLRARSALW